MRLGTVDLFAFGRFTGETLRFSNAPGTIDIVYGDNEAGKSTSLRAVASFLYGIPVRTTDDFVHQKPTLRIGAEVITSEGTAIRLLRRKGAKDTLRDANDAPLAEDVLARLLGGLDRDLFEQMFALSPGALAAGAHDLLVGSGSVGEALFGASVGLTGINDLLQSLEAEATDLFKPGGSVPVLNASLRELDDLRRRSRELELRPSDYLAHERALDTALNERAAVDAELQQQEAELHRLERNKQLLPLAATRTQLLAETNNLGEVVVLAESAREERLSATRDRDRAVSDGALAEQAKTALEERLDLLRPHDTLLARGSEIRALHQEIGAHVKAALDLPGLRAVLRSTTGEARSLLAQTHPNRALTGADELRPTVALRTAIASLSQDYVRITETKRAAEETLAEVRSNLAEAREDEAALPPRPHLGPARATLVAARRLGDVETVLAEDEAEYRAADAQLRADFAELTLFEGTLESLETLRVPSLETVTRFEREYARMADRRRELEGNRSRIEAHLTAHQERLRALDLVGNVPSEADLTGARERRERGWSLVRRTLEADEAADSAEFDEQHPLPDAYEISVRAADDVADRLRREADRVAQKAELEAAIASCNDEILENERQTALLNEEEAGLASEWIALWATTDVAPLPPLEMRAWLQVRQGLVADVATQRKERARLDGQATTVRDHRAAVCRELAPLGRKGNDGTSLAALIEVIDEAIEETARAAAADIEVRERVHKLEQAERKASQTVTDAVTAMANWTGDWSEAVAKLDLHSELRPDQVRAVVDTLAELFIKLDNAATYEGRIDAIERDARAFAASAADLAHALAPDLADLAPDQIVAELHHLLESAQTEATRAAELARQIDEKNDALRQASDARLVAEAELQRLITAAKCKTLEELERAEERSAAALDLRSRVRTVEEQMIQIGAAPAADLAAEVEGLDVSDLEAAIEQQSRLLEDLASRRRELDETVGEERALLKEMPGSDEAAETAAAAEAIKVNVRAQAEQYARLRIAIAILRGQIEKFREASHGPLLSRASYFFSKLTCAEFSGLATGFDARGSVVLLGRRRNGAEITVDQMSDGTRDQLYLALRLATIEQQLERAEPLPLIVDDLLINFDDRRAAAGFKALAEIGDKTQVIFFTHHRHLVELAQKTLQAEQLTLQELGETATTIEAAA
jgi:uncharacterized protein YhaN